MLIQLWFVRFFGFLMRNTSRLIAAYVLLLALSMYADQVDDAQRYPILRNSVAVNRFIQDPAILLLRDAVPTRQGDVDWAPWMFLGGVILLWGLTGFQSRRLSSRASQIVRHREALAFRKKMETAQIPSNNAEPILWKTRPKMKAAIQAPKSPSPQEPSPKSDRERLLEVYAQTKKRLEAQKKTAAFLSVDVVNSTGMKVGEEAAIAERDFRQYKQLVEAVIQKYGYKKASWTPDGVLIAFSDTPTAVLAAQALIHNLDEFNRKVKAIRADFHVRAGIDAGKVALDGPGPLAEVSDKAIDAAGLLQKEAAVDSIWVAAEAVPEDQRDRLGLWAAPKAVGERATLAWQKS